MTNFTESELIPVAVKIIKKNSSGINTSNLIKQLRIELKPEGDDAIILVNRSDDKFSQKVRNLKSHKTLERKNLAIFKDEKFHITENGENYLKKFNSFLINLSSQIHSKKTQPIKKFNIDESLSKVFSSLTPREENVLTARNGIKDQKEKTLESIGKIFSVTRERVRQIEAKAIRKVNHPSRIAYIKKALFYIEEIINKIVFCDQGEFQKKLEGLEIKSSFNLKQLRNILTLFGYNDVSKKIIFLRGDYYIAESSSYISNMVKWIDKLVREKSKKYGIVNIDLIHKEIRRNNFQVNKKVISNIIQNFGGEFKDGSFFTRDYYITNLRPNTNKLVGAIHHTMSVTDKIEIEQLDDCLKRYRRLENFSPPINILKLICEKIGYEISGNYVLNKNYLKKTFITGLKQDLFKMFLDNERIMSYETIYEEINNYNINLNSMNVMIYENLFIQPKKGIFALAGTVIDDEILNRMDEKRKNLLKKLSSNIKFDHDTTDGHIIVNFPKKITTPYIWMEPDYRDLIPEGLYEILSNTSLKIKIYNNKLWISDLVKNIENLPEIISIKLDTANKKVIVL